MKKCKSWTKLVTQIKKQSKRYELFENISWFTHEFNDITTKILHLNNQ